MDEVGLAWIKGERCHVTEWKQLETNGSEGRQELGDKVRVERALRTPTARHFDVFRNIVCALQSLFELNVVTMRSIKTYMP